MFTKKNMFCAINKSLGIFHEDFRWRKSLLDERNQENE